MTNRIRKSLRRPNRRNETPCRIQPVSRNSIQTTNRIDKQALTVIFPGTVRHAAAVDLAPRVVERRRANQRSEAPLTTHSESRVSSLGSSNWGLGPMETTLCSDRNRINKRIKLRSTYTRRTASFVPSLLRAAPSAHISARHVQHELRSLDNVGVVEEWHFWERGGG